MDFEHVLRVLLARAREVEAARENDIVGDGHLRVHEVVRRSFGLPRRRRFPRERRGEGPLQQGELPRDVPVLAPLVDDAAYLWAVDAARDVELALGGELGKRRENRRGGGDGRAEPHAAT